jgi:NhaP-type Na+/H+ or K+/H+ antiporter
VEYELIMDAVVFFLVFFSIVVHGLSISALSLIYRIRGVRPITDAVNDTAQRGEDATTSPEVVDDGKGKLNMYGLLCIPNVRPGSLPSCPTRHEHSSDSSIVEV